MSLLSAACSPESYEAGYKRDWDITASESVLQPPASTQGIPAHSGLRGVRTRKPGIGRDGPLPYTSEMALTDEDVGRNVRHLRVERKMTQATLARRVYLDRTAVSRLENGQRTVTAPELAAIAVALSVDIGSLTSTSQSKAPASDMAGERRWTVESSSPRWLQIHIHGRQMAFVVGTGSEWAPLITLADTSEAPVTKVLSLPFAP